MKHENIKLGVIFAAFAMPAAVFTLSIQSNAQDPGPVPSLPSPNAFVSNLDLACHKVLEGGQTPVRSVVINHLNPVLQKLGFVPEQAALGALEQLCVPVAKNKVVPPVEVLPFVQNVDLACYGATSDVRQPPAAIRLSQLNPVVRKMDYPDQIVGIGKLEQVCTPVAKNGVIPPKEVLELVQFVDVACYHVEPTTEAKPITLQLENLNPVLSRLALRPEKVVTALPQQLCVPVTKNKTLLPDAIDRIVRWVDFEKFDVVSNSIGVASVPLVLTHLNPVFANYEPFKISLGPTTQLDLPVAKDGAIPPL